MKFAGRRGGFVASGASRLSFCDRFDVWVPALAGTNGVIYCNRKNAICSRRRLRAVMSKVGKGRGRRCDCRDVDGSTRRDFLTITSVLGLDLAVGGPVLAEPSDERPKEGDVLVAIEGEHQTPLEPKDILAGGPPVLAWPMDLAAHVVRSG